MNKESSTKLYSLILESGVISDAWMFGSKYSESKADLIINNNHIEMEMLLRLSEIVQVNSIRYDPNKKDMIIEIEEI
jgi:hypothetical protein